MFGIVRMLGSQITIIHHLVNIAAHILVALLSLYAAGHSVYYIYPNGSVIILLLLSIVAAICALPWLWFLLTALLNIINIPIRKFTFKKANQLAQNLDTANSFSFVSIAPASLELGQLFEERTVGGLLVTHHWSAAQLMKIIANKKLKISDFETKAVIENPDYSYSLTDLETIVSGKYDETPTSELRISEARKNTQEKRIKEIENFKKKYGTMLSAIERLNETDKVIALVKHLVIENAQNIFVDGEKKGIEHARITIRVALLSRFDLKSVGIDAGLFWFPLDKFWRTELNSVHYTPDYLTHLYFSEIKERIFDEELTHFLDRIQLSVSMEISKEISKPDNMYFPTLIIDYYPV